MTVYASQYLPGVADLASAGAWDTGVAPAAPWGAGSSVTFASGGPLPSGTSNNATALASVNLASFKVNPACTLPIGADGDPLKITCNSGSGIFDYNGAAARVYIAGGGTATIKTGLIRPVSQCIVSFSSVDFSTLFICGSGLTKFTSSATVENGYLYGSAQAQLLSGSDTVGDIRMSGRSYLLLQRAMTGSSNRIYVPAGCVLEIDLTSASGSVISPASLVGTVVLCGGKLILRNGNVIVDAISGVFDRSRLERPSTATITATPDVQIVDGPVTCTDTLTAIGPGPQYTRV